MRFASGYEQASKERPVKYEGKQKLTLEAADQYSDKLASMLLTRLNNPDRFYRPDSVYQYLSQYNHWVSTALRPFVIDEVLPVKSARSNKLANRLNSHLLNQSFIGYWQSFLQGSRPEEHRRVAREAQDSLAAFSLIFQHHRTKLGEDYYNEDPASTQKRASLEGIIGEYDAGIILLEIAKKNPALVILPSSSFFEHQRGSSRNADFILMDIEKQQAIGGQAKNSVKNPAFKHYDPDYIFLIDGEVDLGNVLNGTRYAGLIAAHHISQIQPSKIKLSSVFPGSSKDFALMQTFAKNQLTKETGPYILKARKHLSERALHALYKKPSGVDVETPPETEPMVAG